MIRMDKLELIDMACSCFLLGFCIYIVPYSIYGTVDYFINKIKTIKEK